LADGPGLSRKARAERSFTSAGCRPCRWAGTETQRIGARVACCCATWAP